MDKPMSSQSTALSQPVQFALDKIVESLKSNLGENLYSCMLYGSAVRGDHNPKVSDINLLIVLEESTPEAHEVISEAVRGRYRVDPFVIGHHGMERSFQTFAMKFLSIHRDYKVICGKDILDDLEIDKESLKFLCEQSLRNIRLRLVHAFIMNRKDRKMYEHFLLQILPSIFVSLSDLVRLQGAKVPHLFSERIPALKVELAIETPILEDLLKFKEKPHTLTLKIIPHFHSQLFHLLNHAIEKLESQWPIPPRNKMN